MRKATILFIQGAGQGAYKEDKKLVLYLQNVLEKSFDICYPKMPNENDPDEELWKAKIDEEIEKIKGKVILVGHSAGGFQLIKYLSEHKTDKDIAGIFFIAIPFFGKDEGWQYDGITLHKDFASKLPPDAPVFFYHSTNDEIVPFTHLAIYATKVPHATIRKIEGRGHQLNNDLSEIVQDINSLNVNS